ncbi:MAG: hypothetical protein LHW64_01120 [Candidatus Cloacimonetes bacterium]|jgi:hypothetical protein|nr:hypothetical protein [Candidatus Cloacimonadota bacterium]MCB5286388.1 hypothetical protein [Candidatus Cloacimonadota bacterium]MCK9184460.1 hypothetical protein [Candidatus Cloacimonadota bacterium]MCK9584126.1 hypothetical protein [Candidatus Cloacimonadota bacterium]MDY0228710.1 hypothetical protein [Candidatus Cloacimonadaceae bacterium]
MKTKFKYGISAYSGTIDEITFGSYKNGTVCIARKYVMPKLTENNAELGTTAKNLATIYGECSEDYKSDLRTYADLYARQVSGPKKIGPNGYAIFVKLFYTVAAANLGTVDLKSLSYGDLSTLFPEITNIAASVNEGYLPYVTGAELLTENM